MKWMSENGILDIDKNWELSNKLSELKNMLMRAFRNELGLDWMDFIDELIPDEDIRRIFIHHPMQIILDFVP